MKHLLLFLTALCGVISAFARDIRAEKVDTIPFAIAGDSRIYVTAFVNGSDSLRFLFDTGASTLVLNVNSPKLMGRITMDETVDNLGTTGNNHVGFSNNNTVQIGSVEWSNAGCAHIPYPPEYWDGVFGLNALAAFNVEINYDDFNIYLYPKNDYVLDADWMAFPFEYKFDVPFIKCRIGIAGKEYDLLLEVDTGSDRVIDLNTPFVQKHNLLKTQKPFAISRIASSDTGSGELKNVFFDFVKIGKYVLPKVAGAFSTITSGMQSKEEVDGMIGNNFLKRFNMYMDFKNNIIYLKPNNLLYSPFYDFLIK